jgi:hypothetical protein
VPAGLGLPVLAGLDTSASGGDGQPAGDRM